MGQLAFLHSSLGDYFCAEGLREVAEERQEGVLDFLENAYNKWGEALPFFVGLLDKFELTRIIAWCEDKWQTHIFALDFLPPLYVRQAEYAPERAREKLALREVLWNVCLRHGSDLLNH